MRCEVLHESGQQTVIARVGRHNFGKAQGLRFWTDREPEQAVGEFNLQLALNVYKFAPRFPPDTARCKGASYRVKPASPEAEEGMTVAPAQP